jgi:hypothetical protein
MEEADKSCGKCGLLTVHTGRAEFPEVTREARRAGQPNGTSGFKCFAQVLDLDSRRRALFEESLNAILALSDKATEWAYVLGEDRRDECGREFTAYIQGFSPKEHVEMVDRERARKWEAEESAKRRQWESDESQKNRAHQAHLAANSDVIQAKVADATERTVKWQAAAVMVAIAGLVIAIIVPAWIADRDGRAPTLSPQSTPGTEATEQP